MTDDPTEDPNRGCIPETYKMTDNPSLLQDCPKNFVIGILKDWRSVLFWLRSKVYIDLGTWLVLWDKKNQFGFGYDKGVFTVIDLLDEKQLSKIKKERHLFSHIGRTEEISCYIEDKEVLSDVQVESTIKMPNKAQEDAVINLKSVQELGKQLGFEWTVVASELGFSRAEITQFHSASTEKKIQAQKMLECWYERSWNKLNKTKILQDALERAGRKDLADKLQCLHWGHQKLSSRVELPSAFPFLITVHKTINNKEGLKKINQLSRKYP